MHITDQIGYPFVKLLVFVICFVSYGYLILIFVVFRRVMNIQIFLFESLRIFCLAIYITLVYLFILKLILS